MGKDTMKFNGHWRHDSKEYRETCLRLSRNLAGFKQDPSYLKIVANDNRDFKIAKAFDDYLGDVPYCAKNDLIGHPRLHNINGKLKSAGTLRFQGVRREVEAWCDPVKIIEIGGGYGGQRVIFYDKLYAIIDIKESLSLVNAYLHQLYLLTDYQYTTLLIDTEDIDFGGEADCCISCFALSEFTHEGIDFYFEHVISKCKAAYITVNYDFEYIEQKLRETFNTVEVTDSFPKTSHHPNKTMKAK